MRFNLFKQLIPVAKTLFPWIHKNFSGIHGWKQDFIKELVDEEHKGTLKILFKVFGRVIILDHGKAEFWRFPRIEYRSALIRAGWLYWAIVILRGQIYYTPKNIEETYEVISNEDNLYTMLREGMKTLNIEPIMDAMDIMLKHDYSSFRIQSNVISKSGDKIRYTITYPNVRVIIMSVNGMCNQVLAAKYHRILSSVDMDYLERNLLHKDDMTAEQLEWLFGVIIPEQ